MNYELAKKLKEAGFPQREVGYEQDAYLGEYLNKKHENDEFYDNAYAPCLSELIEACGDMTLVKKVDTFTYEAFTDKLSFVGSTPEEAVAFLWLEII